MYFIQSVLHFVVNNPELTYIFCVVNYTSLQNKLISFFGDGGGLKFFQIWFWTNWHCCTWSNLTTETHHEIILACVNVFCCTGNICYWPSTVELPITIGLRRFWAVYERMHSYLTLWILTYVTDQVGLQGSCHSVGVGRVGVGKYCLLFCVVFYFIIYLFTYYLFIYYYFSIKHFIFQIQIICIK